MKLKPPKRLVRKPHRMLARYKGKVSHFGNNILSTDFYEWNGNRKGLSSSIHQMGFNLNHQDCNVSYTGKIKKGARFEMWKWAQFTTSGLCLWRTHFKFFP